MGVSVQHLLPYINTYKCNACTANLGRRGYLLTPTSASITPDKDTVTTPSQPTTFVITPEPIIAPAPLLPLSLPEVPIVVTPASTFVAPILDVRADFADSCQIGRSGDRWFLLMVDKTTEYVSLYNTKTRSNPLALLKEYLTFTGRKIRYLRMDNAKEFHSEEMLAFCRDNGIIIQPVIAYNHTGMCRVESYIGVVKSHGRVGMLNANVPLRFHGDAVLDFCIKRNFTWYSQKGLIGNTTAHDRMQPAFDNTLKNVCIPFGSRIISPIPREHSLVRGSSFGDRFVEGIYLHAALTGPAIHIFDMHRKQEIVVKDFTSYPSEFPFKDPSCLTRPGYSAAEIEKMHQEDLADEARITAEITAPAVTRSQSAQMASKQPLIPAPLQPPIVDLSPVLDLQPPPAEEPQQTFISSRDRVLDTPMVSLPELELARAFLNSGYPVILPPSYAAFPQLKDLTPATGPMVVVGYKVQKLSTSKAALWVRFTSPSEYAGKTIQMYPKSLEPKKGPACGADFSLLRAISASNPQATTLRDLGINSSSSAALTSTLLRHFCSMQKPRDSMTAAFDDNGTCDDLDTELHLDFPVLPPQQSAFDGPQNLNEKRKKAIDAAIQQLQKQASQLECTLHPTTDVPFRLSCKTLDTSYVHRHSSPSLLASIRSVLLAPVLPTPTALPSDVDNGPLPESGPHGYSRSTPDPKHRGVAMRHALSPLWLMAEKAEMDGLIKRKVWKAVKRSSLTPEDHIFATRFHYKIKRKNGAFERCKVRLVVQGQHMKKKDASGSGDFEDSFSSVPHASGLRLMLALATQHNMFTDHVDISQAFVQGDLLPGDGHNGKVYISAPPGYPEDPEICYLLQKPLYGMPSAARAWHKTMSAFLHTQGCTKVGYEESMWMAKSNGHQILLAAHIDDFIISCAHRPTLDAFRNALLARFDGTTDGAIQTYLGCEIERDMSTGTTTLSQKHYAEDILRTYGFWGSLPLATMLPPHTRLSKDDCDPTPERAFHLRYRGIVGSLGYLVNMTRPDLAFAYSELSKYVQRPGKAHMAAAEHTLRYLRGTFDKSLRFSRDCPIVDTPWGWVDSDWAGDTDTRRSHAAYIIMMNGGPISWKSRRQDSVALSTSEAEYMAASEVGKEILYLRAILRDVGYAQTAPTNIYEDNLACIAMSTNPVRRKSSRHIDIRVHFCRELYAAGVMKLIPLRTHLMVADALTKSLPGPVLTQHREVMLGHTPFFARLLH